MNKFELSKERDRLSQAIQKYTELKSSGHYSYPDTEGYRAIFCSTDISEDPQTEEGEIELAAFTEEAEGLTQTYRERGIAVRKILSDQFSDLVQVIQDPQCTSLTLIGNGSYRNLWLTDQHATWWNLSEATDHLKQGDFKQRTCGHLHKKQLNVSLGTFVVSDRRKIFSPAGHYINNDGPDEDLLEIRPYLTEPGIIDDYVMTDRRLEARGAKQEADLRVNLTARITRIFLPIFFNELQGSSETEPGNRTVR